jgi:hypothetical protein
MHPIVYVVSQSGLTSEKLLSATPTGGLGFRRFCPPKVPRLTEPISPRSQFRISHVPSPPRKDAVLAYIGASAAAVENTRMDRKNHPNIRTAPHASSLFSRFPIDYAPPALSEQIYDIWPSMPRHGSARRARRTCKSPISMDSEENHSQTTRIELFGRYRIQEPKSDFTRTGSIRGSQTIATAGSVADAFFRTPPVSPTKRTQFNDDQNSVLASEAPEKIRTGA